MERNEQQEKGTEAKPGKEAMMLPSERQGVSFRAEEPLMQRDDSLASGEAKESGERVWDAEEPDRDPASVWGTSIARQPLCLREAIMRPLCPREGRRDGWESLQGLPHLHLHPLAAHQVHARPSLPPAAPVPPEQGSGTTHEGMEQHTHPRRLLSGSPMPLTLLSQ
jgi:hypothetical protein